eukprot:Nitzschia sp. Nitz4//scaffold216_size36101//19471//20820//NITZ4_007781-RA/size36101-processed-gene-0.45-mRNA-1//-1//CDS//3329542194//2848//frame0
MTTETAISVYTDDPNYSSATLCTTLSINGRTFRPEFTHQLVEKEGFQGHRPLTSVLEEVRQKLQGKLEDGQLIHLSHQHHGEASKELDIQIKLSPSWRKCQLAVHQLPVATKEEEPLAKKPKLEPSPEPLTKQQIQDILSNAIPDVSTDCLNDYLHQPIGKVLAEYSLAMKSNQEESLDYVISVADGPQASEYHSMVQRLALWFIENADNVNVADTQGGFWKVLFLWQRISSNQYSLVGYMTLFHFNAPFFKPKPGIVTRICQAVVLPPYQGQGHGKRLFQAVYDLAHSLGHDKEVYSSDEDIVQVNVEDPAPGFTILRNKFDLEWLTINPTWLESTSMDLGETLAEDAKFTALSETDAFTISTKSRITPRQVQIVHELGMLRKLLLTKDYDLSPFRLMVKRRLNREHQEDMSDYPSKEEKKAYLAELFDEEYQVHLRVLGKANPEKGA